MNATSPSSKTTLPSCDDYDLSQNDAKEVYLIVLAGTNVGQVYPLDKPAITIGREDNADIQILDSGISRRHAMILQREKGKYEIKDLGSRNGTLINGTAIGDQTYELKRGDKVHVGTRTVLRASYADELETQYAKKMAQVALRDGLTGIFNRRYLNERLATEVSFSVRHKSSLSLILSDIDHFKKINDTYGHPVGDAVLKHFCAVVSQVARTEDVFARYGGEEFAVLCRESDEAAAAVLAERIRTSVTRQVANIEGIEVKYTVSLGIAELAHCKEVTASHLVESADKALYQAKRQGRNRVIRFSARV